MITIEREFELAKFMHKIRVLRAKIADYYITVQQNSVNLPDFVRDDTPEKLAQRDVETLILTDINKFNRLYEKAWCEIASLI